MTKKQLYFVIGALCVVLLYVLFIPTADVETPQTTPAEQVEDIQTAVDEALAAEGVAQEAMIVQEEALMEDVVLEGTFVGLLDGENAYQKKFKYMLLNDGEEVLRIDLRPLVGMSDINIIEKLGVSRGDAVTVVGVINDGEFQVESIE